MPRPANSNEIFQELIQTIDLNILQLCCIQQTILLQQFCLQFRQAVELFSQHQIDAIMEHTKIYDSRLQHLRQSMAQLLDRKIEEQCQMSSQSSTNQSPKPQTLSNNKPGLKRAVLPDFTFQFVKYKIRDSVEYEVIMIESYVVLGRKIKNSYSFKTRYSMLEKLSEKAGTVGFPAKKIFGNKKEDFIKQRMKLLQVYLNQCSRRRNKQFLKFVKQIKDRDFDLEMTKDFKL